MVQRRNCYVIVHQHHWSLPDIQIITGWTVVQALC